MKRQLNKIFRVYQCRIISNYFQEMVHIVPESPGRFCGCRLEEVIEFVVDITIRNVHYFPRGDVFSMPRIMFEIFRVSSLRFPDRFSQIRVGSFIP